MADAQGTRAVEDLHLQNLTKRFGDHAAVDDLTLTIPAGSFFALLGASGCGKTTTLRMVAGLEDPTAGTITIGDQDITGLRAFERPVNTVFQSYALFPHLDIFENVAFGLRRRGSRTSRGPSRQMLDLVELGPMARRKPTQLSGGQQQRVAVARALINRPDVLLLDEPLGALDLKLRRQMQIELKRIQTEVGTTFVHVTHDQEEAMTMADTVAVMNAGRIEQLGHPADIYELPRTVFVANFLGQSNLIEGTPRRDVGRRRARRGQRPHVRDPVGPLLRRGLVRHRRRAAGEDHHPRRRRRRPDPRAPQPAQRHGHRCLVHGRLDAVPGAHRLGAGADRLRAERRRRRPQRGRRRGRPALVAQAHVRPRRQRVAPTWASIPRYSRSRRSTPR